MLTYLKRGLFIAIFASFAMCAYAEDAPVYDVDSYPPQFDGQSVDPATVPQGAPQQTAPQSAPRALGPMISSAAPAQQAPAAGPAPSDDDQAPPPSGGPQQDASSFNVPAPTQQLSEEQRIARIEQQMNNSSHSDTTPKVDDMQSQVQALRGQVDELTHQIQQMQAQQKTMYSDLDKRLSQKGASSAEIPQPSSDEAAAETDSNIPAGTIKPKAKPKKAVAAVSKPVTNKLAATSLASAADQPNSAEEQQIYQTAYGLIKAKKYKEAADTLQNMLQKYPSGQFAANAHYWLGELYGLLGKNDQAASEFNVVVKHYPDSPKIADAQLKLGLLYAAQFKWPDAKSAFKVVMNNYPGTASARLASEQLKQLKSAGH